MRVIHATRETSKGLEQKLDMWQGLISPPGANADWQFPGLASRLCAASLPPACPRPGSLRGSSSRELPEGSNVAVAAAASAPLPPSLTQGQATSWHLQPREFLRDLIFKAFPTSPGIDLG